MNNDRGYWGLWLGGIVCVLLVLFAVLVWQAALHYQAKTPSTPQVPVVASSSLPILYEYIEITGSCGPYFDGACANLRTGPGRQFAAVSPLRNGVVLKVASTTVVDGHTWYRVGFDGDIRYPERVKSGWYVSGDYARVFYDRGYVEDVSGRDATTTKRIVINITTETLTAYDGTTTFMTGPISTGLQLTPTPLGKFYIKRKMPDSYMQGPVPGISDQYYDLPGVPWDLYFTDQGAAIHGAYWHNHFGEPWSHGCVNLSPEQAKELYGWADLGVPVVVER